MGLNPATASVWPKARNARRGAQFTPQGVLKFPLKATRPDEVLLEIRELLSSLAPTPVSA